MTVDSWQLTVIVETITLGYLFVGANIAYQSIFQALGKGINSLMVSLIRLIIVVLPLAYVFTKLPNAQNMIWWAFPIAEGCALVLAIILMRNIRKSMIDVMDDLNKNEDIEELATKVRRYWNLGDGIIGNMLTLLEINGIIVSDANINKKGALSFSQKQTVNGNSRYFVSLGNDKKSACTRNYDLAYELAYIVATEANIQSKKFSKDEFACAFLMPKESFIQDLKMVNDLEDYVELKKKWIVPISAIILRSYQLGEISYKKYMYLMNEMDKKGWLKKEPLEENIKATSPMLLKKSIDVLIDNNIISKASLVMNLSNWGLHLNQDEVEVLLGFKEGK